MKYRFIEYENDIYVVVGIGYDQLNYCPEYFLCILLDKDLYKASLQVDTIKIPIDKASEITNKNKLLAILVLYG